MEGTKEYFISLFTICAVCALCDMLTEFAGKGVSSAFKLICSLTILITLFSALFSGCDGINSLNALENRSDSNNKQLQTEYSEDIFIENIRTELEKNLSYAIYEKFGIKPESLSIQFSTERKDGETIVSVSSATAVFPENTDDAAVSSALSYLESLNCTENQTE